MLKVLVIEDDTDHAELIEQALACGGPEAMEVTTAATLEEASNLLDVLQFGCIVLDHNLPDGKGTELLRKCQGAVDKVPVVGLSTSEDPQVALADFRGGCIEFISKHDAFRDGSLRRRVRDAIGTFERRKQAMLAGSAPVIDVFGQIETLLERSRTDPLMGILNRGAFDEISAEWHASAQSDGGTYGLCMIDVDNFKKYNDTYGHVAGDEVLRGVAGALRSVLRGRDCIARFGGEEIVVLLADASEASLRAVGERLRAAVHALGKPHEKNPGGVVTVSIGVTSYLMGSKEEFTSVLERADKALYTAKETGRNKVVLGT
jgi:two-component system, chemotaxis family, response regulator WspR